MGLSPWREPQLRRHTRQLLLLHGAFPELGVRPVDAQRCGLHGEGLYRPAQFSWSLGRSSRFVRGDPARAYSQRAARAVAGLFKSTSTSTTGPGCSSSGSRMCRVLRRSPGVARSRLPDPASPPHSRSAQECVATRQAASPVGSTPHARAWPRRGVAPLAWLGRFSRRLEEAGSLSLISATLTVTAMLGSKNVKPAFFGVRVLVFCVDCPTATNCLTAGVFHVHGARPSF